MKDKTLGTTKKTISNTTFSHEQLWAALRDCEDLMDRCMAPGFVMGNTAKHIVNDEDLDGDSVEWGLRETDLAESTVAMMKTLRPDIQIGDNEIWYDHNGVKVVIKVIHDDFDFFKNLNLKAYYAGDYLYPNPFDGYWKARFVVK